MESERETLLVVAGRAEVGARLGAYLRGVGYRVVVAHREGDVEAILCGLEVDALVVCDDGELSCRLSGRAGAVPVVYVSGIGDAVHAVAAQLAGRPSPSARA